MKRVIPPPGMSLGRFWTGKRAAAVLFALGLGLVVTAFLPIPIPERDLQKESVHSLRVLDKRGSLLREFLNDLEGRGRWVTISEVSPYLVEATLAAEDKRFYRHNGVDIPSVARALLDNIKAGRVVSGGSTITQQVIRNIYHHPRTLWFKILECWYAVRLEHTLTKSQILEQYLNRVPYGSQLYGVEAASRHYFGKPARDLSLAESAFLAGLPNAPSALAPPKNLHGSLSRQRTILRKMREQLRISAEEHERALVQPVHILLHSGNFRAPHAVEMVAREMKLHPEIAIVQTTIDDALQQTVEWIVKAHLATLARKNATNAAVIVMDNATAEVVAFVGSADYADEAHGGQVNGATALRQPGSAIKPFTYGVALEQGYQPSDIIPDLPVHLPDDRGDYIPENYDRQYHGPVSIRVALACSYNIPAVRLCQAVGNDALLQRLLLAGISSLDRPIEYYGPGLTLGNGEVSLLELTAAYASLANRGVWRYPRLIRSVCTADGTDRTQEIVPEEPPRRVFDERVAFLLANILSDPVARRQAFGSAFQFPFACAVKTGTTKDYRDNWALGYSSGFTVGVWVGNFDGTPMRGVSGVTGAGQIFSDIMEILTGTSGGTQDSPFSPPPGLVQRRVCPRSGRLPSESCGMTVLEWFLEEHVPSESCSVHQRYLVSHQGGTSEEEVFEIFPPEYSDWCTAHRIPQPPDGSSRIFGRGGSKSSSSHEPSVRLAITSPNDGDLFKIDPHLRPEYQMIRIVARIPADLSNPVLRVDDKAAAAIENGSVWWQLQTGEHHLQLAARHRGKTVVSMPVTIGVE